MANPSDTPQPPGRPEDETDAGKPPAGDGEGRPQETADETGDETGQDQRGQDDTGYADTGRANEAAEAEPAPPWVDARDASEPEAGEAQQDRGPEEGAGPGGDPAAPEDPLRLEPDQLSAGGGTEAHEGAPDATEGPGGPDEAAMLWRSQDGSDAPEPSDAAPQDGDAPGEAAARETGEEIAAETDASATGAGAADPDPDAERSSAGALGLGADAAAGAAAAGVAAAAATDTARADTVRSGEADRRTAATPPPPPPAQRRGGFFPLVLGGIVAAGVGYAAAWYLDREGIVRLSGAADGELSAAVAAQGARLAETEAALSDLSSQVSDLAPRLDDATAAARVAAEGLDGLRADLAPLQERLDALAGRMDAIEQAPILEDPTAAAALEGFRGEAEALRAEVAAVSTRMEEVLEAAEAARAAAEARAAEAEAAVADIDAATEAAQTAVRLRAAFGQIEFAFASGGPFGPALDEIAAAGVSVPEALPPLAESGVPTLAELRADFPPAAREALSIALRDVGDAPLAERAGSFLRLQFGVRSLAPREGGDADAVLSRAEASLAEGDLEAALAEVNALPAHVRAPFDPWITTAETRQRASAALAALGAEIESL